MDDNGFDYLKESSSCGGKNKGSIDAWKCRHSSDKCGGIIE